MKSKLLIIGKKPPPIGGVSIHVKRLLEHLDKSKTKYSFYDLKEFKLSIFIITIIKHQQIHLHTSSPTFRLISVLLAKLLFKNIYITVHGNLGRFSWLKNQMDYIALRLSTIPIVINQGSYDRAIKLNKNTILASAFIPPLNISPLSDSVNNRLHDWLSGNNAATKKIFCTNAFNVTFDKNGNEIYGISKLVKLFQRTSNQLLIFSDPSGMYNDYLKQKKITISPNVFIINEPHDFINILKLSDVLIRSTTTDGDSLTVREAIYYNKIVIASDCVERPKRVQLYPTLDFSELQKIIINISEKNSDKQISEIVNGADQLIKKVYELD